MPTVHRYANNVGEISPKLWYRSDMDKYHFACRYLENFIPDKEGPVTRRPGWRTTAKIADVESPPIAHRLFTFEISTDERYLIVMTPNKNITGDDDRTEIRVYNDTGGIITTLYAAYLPTEYSSIQYLLSGDVMFLFHPNHEPALLERNADLTWSIDIIAFNGGPWGLTPNTDKSIILTVNANRWDSGTTYETGDYVYTGVSDTLVGNASNLYVSTTVTIGRPPIKTLYYWTCLSLTSAPSVSGFTAEDRIEIEGSSALVGQWTIKSVDEANNKIYIDTGTFSVEGDFTNDYAGESVAGDTIYRVGSRPTHYQSLVDSNLNNDPTASPDEWAERSTIYGSDFTLTSSSDYFEDSDVEKKLRLQYDLNISDTRKWLSTDEGEYSNVLPAFGTVTMRTSDGIWDGEVALQQSIDGGATWDDIGVIRSNDGSYNGEIIREITEYDILVRAYLRERNAATSDTGCNLYIEVTGIQYAYVEITEVISATEATVDLLNHIPDYLSTWKWTEGLFGGVNGYPATGAIYQERLVLSGIPGEPSVLAFSATDDFNNFQPQTLDSSAFTLEFASSQRWPVRWLVPKKVLLFGTERGEWSIKPGTNGLTPTEYSIEQHTEHGSANHQALASADLMMYIAAGNREIRAMRYSFEKDGYESDLLNFFARHLGESSFTEFAFVRSPDQLVWVVRENGELVSFTYDRGQQVNAWSRHPTGDDHEVISIGVASGDGIGDDLWAIVRRDSGVYLERMQTGNYCVDNLYEFEDVDTNSLYVPYADEPNAVTYDNTWRASSDQQDNWSGLGRLLVLNIPVSNLIIKEDGITIDPEEDYIELSTGDWIWIPRATGTLTVFDFTTQLTEGLQYFLYDADTSQCAKIINEDLDPEALNWFIGGDFSSDTNHIPQANGFVIFPDSLGDEIEGFDNGDPLTEGIDYVLFDVPIFVTAFDMANPETLRIGIPVEAELATTDMMAGPNVGGPGGWIKASMVEMYLADAAGGEISVSDGDQWDRIKYQPANALVTNTSLELSTGKFDVDVNQGRQETGLLFRCRNTSPYPMTILNIGVKVDRNGKP